MMVESAFRNTSLPPHFFIWGPCNALGYNGDANQRVLREQLGSGPTGKKPIGGKETMECESIQQKREQDMQEERKIRHKITMNRYIMHYGYREVNGIAFLSL